MATISDVISFLQDASRARDPNDADYGTWVETQDVVPFLERSTTGDVPVYISNTDSFLYAVMVPLDALNDDYWTDLLGWNFNPSTGWTSWITSADGEQNLIGMVYPPIEHTRSRILDMGEAVVFDRYFEPRTPRHYLEPNQKVIHVASAHWDSARNAYCRLNGYGDIVDVARETVIPKGTPNGAIYTIEAKSLDRYLFVSRQALIRVFDFGRSPHRDRVDRRGGDITEEQQSLMHHGIVAQLEIERSPARIESVRMRGVQVLRELPGRERWLSKYRPQREEPVPFIIEDLKHGVVRTYPGERVTPPGTPYEEDWPPLISPAYFRPEVLSRFRSDPDKYRLTSTTIACRGAWFLRSYDINEAGQVYVYLKDLWEQLPREEQLYWKSFNEAPNAGLTRRSIDQDFLARPWTGPDPLRDLKQTLRMFPAALQHGTDVLIWAGEAGTDDHTLDRLHYLTTEARKEWEAQIVELTKVVVEGLQKAPLEAVAFALDVEVEQQGTISLMRDVLTAAGVDAGIVSAIHGPLTSLYQIRSKSGAVHRGSSRLGAGPLAYYRTHFRELIEIVAAAMQLLAEEVERGTFNLPRSPTA